MYSPEFKADSEKPLSVYYSGICKEGVTFPWICILASSPSSNVKLQIIY